MSKLKGSIAYLSGPMDRVEWNDAIEWRDEMDEFLHDLGIGTFNPCNKPNGEQEDPSFRERIQKLKDAGEFDEVTRLMKDMCRVDLRMVDNSQFVIAHVDMDSHMCGTYWEMTTARYKRSPVIIHCKQDVNKLPNWLFGVCNHNEMFGTWKEVKDHIAGINDGSIEADRKYWHFFNTDVIFGKNK